MRSVANVKVLPIARSNTNWKLATLALATLATLATFAKTFDWHLSAPVAEAKTWKSPVAPR